MSAVTARDAALEKIQAQQNAVVSPEREARRAAWQTALVNLTRQIGSWVDAAGAATDGLIAVQPCEESIVERYLAEYQAAGVRLQFPSREEIHFRPVATYVLGADGRVDVEGAGGAAKLVWNRSDDSWQIAELTPVGTWRRRPLTEEVFWELVADLLSDPPA